MSNQLWMLLLVPGLPLLGIVAWTHWFIRRRDRASRRPFEEMLRPPGWSLQQRSSDLLDDFTLHFMAAILVSMVAWAFAVSEKGPPAVALAIGLAASTYSMFRAGRSIVLVSNHRLGLIGEQVVGQILDRLALPQTRAFHDLEVREPGKKPWNIDHVVVSPGGIFVIETKARRKPKAMAGKLKGHQLIFDGQQIIFPPPMKPDRHGLAQAQRNAQWLASKLSSLNGENVPVSPALVFPGWWVDATGKGAVSVMNAKQLPGFIGGRKPILSDRTVRAISNQLEDMCRIDLSAPS